ncbi:MAG: amidohydrolase family protein [Acidimicrobiales bacterium]|jgi:N-acyl-D-aspartate/D-glutamate deacylase|nr:amidohydrolase family protein [Acidimicrobiales bacterium]MDP6901217.1 amidohydrolase family protein [Acidimicrobiales bacterium]
MADYDIHIAGGTIVDGTRVPRYQGDLWIKDGRIAKIGGRADGVAEEVVDATGKIVAPGFVDLHTHYDAQIRWDPWCTISGYHGVTSVVLGNCGFGFAPVAADFRERSMLTMTRTEAIPFESMKQGMDWDWETIPEYLDSLDRIPKGVNVIQYMPTASLMTYVMGLEKAKAGTPASEAERKEMARLLHEGMDAGLCGFSIQRLGPDSVQADFDGSPMVTDIMCDEDILNLAQVLADRDEGFIQITQGTGDIRADIAFLEDLAGVAQRPILHNVVAPARRDPEVHRRPLRWIEKCREKGLPIYAQCGTGRAGFAFTLEHWNLYDASPAWRAVTTGSKEEKIQKMQDPELRQALMEEADEADKRLQVIQAGVGGNPRSLVVQGVNRQADLQEYVGKSVGEIAETEGKNHIEVMLDLSLRGDLNVEFLGPDKGSNAEFMAEMMTESPYAIPGVSDGGAHTKFFTGGAYTTDFLTWLVRDEGVVTLEEAHYRLSNLPAHAAGFRDRGTLREGAAADVLVYDMEELEILPNWIGDVEYDLPGGEWRRVQRAAGYDRIIVNGETTFQSGECTGATPGKLLRHGRD